MMDVMGFRFVTEHKFENSTPTLGRPEGGTPMKKDVKHLEEGCVLFRSMLLEAIDRGTPVSDTAAKIVEQFIDLVDVDDSEPGWAIRVLVELSKDPEPIGTYARSVEDAIEKEFLL
jgi:hypothetical protein